MMVGRKVANCGSPSGPFEQDIIKVWADARGRLNVWEGVSTNRSQHHL
jgi:hypothetical protein